MLEMVKSRFALGVVGALMVAFALAATAEARAVPQVTGGASLITAGGIDFSLSVNAIVMPDGETVKGQIDYERTDLAFTADVECSNVNLDGTVATAAGPVTNYETGSGGAWVAVTVREGGTGSGDQVRVMLTSEATGKALCSDLGQATPGVVHEGNFTIR